MQEMLMDYEVKIICIHADDIPKITFLFSLGAIAPQWALASSFTRSVFLDHTRRHTAVGRTPLDERSARRRDLYLTTHNIHNRETTMPPVGFEPTISAGERPQTYALDHEATGTGFLRSLLIQNLSKPSLPKPSDKPGALMIAAPQLLQLYILLYSFYVGESNKSLNKCLPHNLVPIVSTQLYHFSTYGQIQHAQYRVVT